MLRKKPATLAMLPQFLVRNSTVGACVASMERSTAQTATRTVARVSRNQSYLVSLEGMGCAPHSRELYQIDVQSWKCRARGLAVDVVSSGDKK
jgi:hypothetical protein